MATGTEQKKKNSKSEKFREEPLNSPIPSLNEIKSRTKGRDSRKFACNNEVNFVGCVKDIPAGIEHGFVSLLVIDWAEIFLGEGRSNRW